MKAIMVMFDSLNRRMLPPYGCDWVHAPNFQRLAERAVTFDNATIGSMPCMPARREFHTGRYNFLHRSWGPLEPFDDSVPQLLSGHGVYTHLTTDHTHYFEDGGQPITPVTIPGNSAGDRREIIGKGMLTLIFQSPRLPVSGMTINPMTCGFMNL